MPQSVLLAELPALEPNAVETVLRFKIAAANDARATITIQGCEDCVEELTARIADVCNEYIQTKDSRKPCGGCPEPKG